MAGALAIHNNVTQLFKYDAYGVLFVLANLPKMRKTPLLHVHLPKIILWLSVTPVRCQKGRFSVFFSHHPDMRFRLI